MHFDMKEASATSLLVMVIASLAGLAARMGTAIQIDYLSVLPFALASMIGGPIGASLTRKAKSTTLTFPVRHITAASSCLYPERHVIRGVKFARISIGYLHFVVTYFS